MPEPTRDQLEVLLRRVRLSMQRPPNELRERVFSQLCVEIDALLPRIHEKYRPPTREEAFLHDVETGEQPDD